MYPKTLAFLKPALASLLLGLILATGANAVEPILRPDGIVFPAVPRENIQTGSVEVMVAVDENGDTASVTVLSSTHQSLEDSVLAAVKRWKFEPATNGGRSTIGMYRHAFRFEDGHFVLDDALIAAFANSTDEPKIRPEGIVLAKLPQSLEKVSGVVQFQVAVNGEGRVVDVVTASSTDAALEGVVKSAVSQWRFDPVTRDGMPVGGLYHHTFRYDEGQEQFDGKLWRVLSAASHVPTLRADGIVLPELPEGVKANGKTEVLVAVSGEGRVASVVSVASTDERVAKAMKQAITQWRFDPALSNGRPVVGLYRHAFTFEDGRYVLSDEIWSALSRDPVEPELLPVGLDLPKLPRSYSDATGKISLMVAVDLQGQVVDVMANSATDEGLVETVSDAVGKWRFRPAARGGEAAIGLFEYVFRYEDGEPLIGPKLWNAMRQSMTAPEPVAKSEPVKEELPEPQVEILPEPERIPLMGSHPVNADPSIKDLKDSGYEVFRAVEPELPAELRGISGYVNLVYDLTARGSSPAIVVESYSHEELVEPVIRVAHRWRFQSDGRGQAGKIRVPMVFNEKRDTRYVFDRLVDADFGNVDTKPKPIRRYVPTIPASRQNASGEVQALIAVDTYGYVTAVEIENGLDRRVDNEVEEALYRWKFEPAAIAGRAVDCKLRLNLKVNNGLASIEAPRVDTVAEALSSPQPRINTSDPRNHGFVLLRLRVDERGFVTDSRVVESTNDRLDGPSLEASKDWRFTPARAGGKPVASTVSVPFIFSSDG
ncbi:TonB family protein [Pelagicoccus sp. SDUM812003]|uniref:TonB family protein n=1 Tax=Pelagicoccus sp. SDUM812003 TaxID=3041267 RepID=UPI00280F762A|nr:TonB family protein [Pelagicoccus sp. SDUM812003]MDQ8202289.1 TonB family protein [Pelagicoccus sp. SDUM812003]